MNLIESIKNLSREPETKKEHLHALKSKGFGNPLPMQLQQMHR